MTDHATTMLRAATTNASCRCDDPIPVQRAERKGAAVSLCQRCGLRVPLRLR